MRRKVFKPTKIKTIEPQPVKTFFQKEAEELIEIHPKANFSLAEKFIKNRHEQLIVTAAQIQSAFLTSNQISIDKQMFVLNKEASQDLGWIHQSYGNGKHFQGYINPKIIKGKNPCRKEQEDPSFPFIFTENVRYQTIQVEYQLVNRQLVRQSLNGFQAILFQHAYDYMIGRVILDWRLHHGNIKIQQSVQSKLPKSTQICSQFSKQLKKVFEEYPHYIQVPNQINEEHFKKQKEEISIESDFLRRFHKHYSKQMLLLMERLSLDLVQI